MQAYHSQAGVTGTGTISEGPVETTPTTVPTADERSLDVGVVATAAPNSNIMTYAGSGGSYAAIQEAIWGGGTKLSELSTSFGLGTKPLPGSPFYAALQGLNTDAALNNITMFDAGGDGGSSSQLATGTVAANPDASGYNVVVGGTSTSDQQQVAAAGAATTDGGPNINSGVATLLAQAIAGNAASLETLVAGGLLQDPTATSNVQSLLQTVWNQYDYRTATSTLDPGYPENEASAGGVSTALTEPAYQLNAGIDTQALQQADGVPAASAADRGLPDVSALAGGNTHYLVPNPDLSSESASGTPDPTSEGGTSAAAPLWAALVAQIQAVFINEGLPALGTINDLLYQASVIDPAAFDDVQFGSDTSSFVISPNGPVTADEAPAANGTQATETITPTGIGYSAAPGYDLASGLGTPDGILLARALTQIAEAQEYDPSAPAVTDATGATSAASQTLIVQPTLTSSFASTIAAGGSSFTPASDGSGQGWSARIAQQTLQSYFAPALAEAIAGQAQASSTQVTVANGQALSVSIGGVAATAVAQADTSQFGFVDDTASGQSVTLARPLAVAETYGGQNDTDAIVRIRQDSADTDTLAFYRVDDLDGTIGGIAPGQPGYAAAAAARGYSFAGGAQSVTGPGDGAFLQTDITGVNNGDIIAFQTTDQTTGTTSWGLASQNAGGANALWSYGADTWGFDDGSAGGDGFDSMVFQLDFTSDAGSGLLADDATPACFVAGTLIGTPLGERLVEQLAIGDMVVTAKGQHRAIRWIGRRSYGGRFLAAQTALQPVRFRAGSLGDGLPRRDLLVSPEHAMLLDGVLVPARCLVDGERIVQETGLEAVDYVHVELDSHDVVLAEGAPSETFVDDHSRGIFHNAAEYAVLYPEAVATPARYCAERLRDGEALAALRTRVARRRVTATASGLLLGRLDEAGPTRISGWAYDSLNPDHPVRLVVTADDVVLGVVTADRDRADVRQAGYGHGRLGFELLLETGLDPSVAHTVRVLRAADGVELANSPLTVQPGTPTGVAVTAATLRGCVDEVTRLRVRGWAWDPAAAFEPVALQIIANGTLVAMATANRFRHDVRAAGIGTGWHGFDVAIPGGLSPLTRQVIEVRRATDGAALPGEPTVLDPVDSFGPELERAVSQAVSGLEESPASERVLSFMLAQADRLLRRKTEMQELGHGARHALVIDEWLPDAGRDAGSQAVLSHIGALRQLGFAVSIAANDELEAGAAAALVADGIAVHAAPFYRSVEDVLRRHAGRFDTVYVHRCGPASRYLNLIRCHQPQARVIYSVADLHHVRLARQAAFYNDAALLKQSREVRNAEFAAAARADAVITHSRAEAALLRRAVPHANIHCVGWEPARRRCAVPFTRRTGLAFVGSFDHAPNLDAVRWLVDDVMPLVWRHDPAITCTLAGSAMPDWMRRLAGPGIAVAGAVPDLGTVFGQVRLTVAPLRFGAGLKGKVLDSLAAGLPCAMTPIAAEGMALSPVLRAVVGRDAAAVAAIIVRLHNDRAENRRVAAAGRSLISRHYGRDVVRAGLEAAVARQDQASSRSELAGRQIGTAP